MKPLKHSKAASKVFRFSLLLATAIVVAGFSPAMAHAVGIELVEKQNSSAASTLPVLSSDIGIALGGAVLACIMIATVALKLRRRRDKKCIRSIEAAFKTGMMQAVLPKIEEDEHEFLVRAQVVQEEIPAPPVYVGSHARKPASIPATEIEAVAKAALNPVVRPTAAPTAKPAPKAVTTTPAPKPVAATPAPKPIVGHIPEFTVPPMLLSEEILKAINDSMPTLNRPPIDRPLGRKIPSLNAKLEMFGHDNDSENEGTENSRDFIDRLGALTTLTSANDDMMIRPKDNIRAIDPIKVTIRRNKSMTFAGAKNSQAEQVQLSKSDITSSLPDVELKSMKRMKFFAGIF